MQWLVIVTTAPRKQPTIHECILSFRNCGWEPIVLAEPNSPKPSCETIYNEEVMGIWRNWVKSVRIALESPADIIMTAQDDITLHPDSKEFTESILWPADNCGFISLYTPRHYTIRNTRLLRKIRKKDPNAPKLRPPGVNRIYTGSLWGACALVFPRKVLETIIEHPLVESWAGARPKSGNKEVIEKRRRDPSTIANSDTAIGKLINKHKYSMWFVDPSPGQHISKFSTIKHGDNSGNRNAYRIADHSLPLQYQVFPT